MRSIAYTVFKSEPKNMADCIDYYLRKQKDDVKPRVFLRLINETRFTEHYILQSLVGKYTWKFHDGIKTEHDTVYGGIFEHEQNERQQISLENANCRLQSDLEILCRLGITVNQSNDKFSKKKGSENDF